MWRTLFIDGPVQIGGYLAGPSYLPTRWDRRVPRWLWIPWVLVKTYLVIAGGFLLTMYYLHRLGLPSLWMAD